MKIRYLIAGDSTLIVEFGEEISPHINEKVRSLMHYLEKKDLDGIVEMVPTYRSLAIHYDPMTLEIKDLKTEIDKGEHEFVCNSSAGRVVEVPVLYGGEYGPDIANVARHNGITEEEVIERHSSKEYLVHMLGFTPGFPYLGGMDEKIATPRLKVPRAMVQGGSVGIAGSQTGIYPVDSPGGWQIIGRTPMKLFDVNREEKFLFAPGDILKFTPVDSDEYKKIEEGAETKIYDTEVQGE